MKTWRRHWPGVPQYGIFYILYRLHGSYEAIEGGQTMDALVDLTGGLAERYELKGADPNMYRHLRRAHKSRAFIACSRKVLK